ncbi:MULTISPECIES: hypothetical protein [Myxococcaceae]|nr:MULTISPECIES: hypothetical protein [Myxococcaceae]
MYPCTSPAECPSGYCCNSGWVIDDGPNNVCLPDGSSMCLAPGE